MSAEIIPMPVRARTGNVFGLEYLIKYNPHTRRHEWSVTIPWNKSMHSGTCDTGVQAEAATFSFIESYKRGARR